MKEEAGRLSAFSGISELELKLNNIHCKEVSYAKPFSVSLLPQNVKCRNNK